MINILKLLPAFPIAMDDGIGEIDVVCRLISSRTLVVHVRNYRVDKHEIFVEYWFEYCGKIYSGSTFLVDAVQIRIELEAIESEDVPSARPLANIRWLMVLSSMRTADDWLGRFKGRIAINKEASLRWIILGLARRFWKTLVLAIFYAIIVLFLGYLMFAMAFPKPSSPPSLVHPV